MTLEASASRIATTNACPKSLSGSSELRFSTAKPPAVVRGGRHHGSPSGGICD